jgi:hypothetical protein
MGTELFPETLENPHVLTGLSARENFIVLQLRLRKRISEMCWNFAVPL